MEYKAQLTIELNETNGHFASHCPQWKKQMRYEYLGKD